MWKDVENLGRESVSLVDLPFSFFVKGRSNKRNQTEGLIRGFSVILIFPTETPLVLYLYGIISNYSLPPLRLPVRKKGLISNPPDRPYLHPPSFVTGTCVTPSSISGISFLDWPTSVSSPYLFPVVMDLSVSWCVWRRGRVTDTE